MTTKSSLHPIPPSWSSLTWRQLADCWACKMRYGGNPGVAAAAALMALCGIREVSRGGYSDSTGEAVYTLKDRDGRLWTATPRELAQMARTMKWFDYPYGDPGKEAVKDENGKVIEEAVAPVRGYVNTEWLDAMALPEETIVVAGNRLITGSEWQGMTDKRRDGLHFQLPSVALYNLTWQQYRTLQALAPQLFQEGVGDDEVLSLQAQFIAHTLVPATGSTADGDPFAPTHEYKYDADRAEQSVTFWRDRLRKENGEWTTAKSSVLNPQSLILFNLCFQCYQTAMRYYEQVFPLLFNGSGKSDPLQDALTGETKTLNAVMKYQGYTKPEDVYAENLPIILSTLNTMAEEAKQIEQMNARIKKKH